MKPLLCGLMVGMSGLLTGYLQAVPSPYVISARPGSLNYFEGKAWLNQQPIIQAMLGKTFLQKNDVLSTTKGKVEVLLTPGIFLRIGDDSEIRMSALSLIDGQIELLRGEAMIEADELVKGDNVQVMIQGASAIIRKSGLYRFTAGQQPSVAVLQGKLQVSANGQVAEAGKGQEILIGEQLKKDRFNAKQEDDLYAWSNQRSEYEAAASYQSAQSAAAVYGSNTQGWIWNGLFDSWAWLPGADLAFFSPFGYGFFAPGVVGYAPICYGRTSGGRWRGPGHGFQPWVPLAIDPRHPPARGATPRSPWQNRVATIAASKVFARTGFRDARGGYIPVGSRMTSSPALGYFGFRNSSRAAITGNGGHVGGWARTVGAGGSGGASAGARGGSGGGGHFGAGGGSFGGGGHFGGGGGGHSGGGSSGGGGGGHR